MLIEMFAVAIAACQLMDLVREPVLAFVRALGL